MDKILFKGMKFYAYHGVFPEESTLGQIYIVDLEVSVDLKKAGDTDQLEDTINYADLYQIVKKMNDENKFKLIEKLAEVIAAEIIEADLRIQEVMVRITKPHPPIPGHYDSVGVEIKRGRS